MKRYNVQRISFLKYFSKIEGYYYKLKIITIVTRYADKRLEEFWKNLWRNDETLSARERKLTRLLTHVYIHQPCIPNVEGDVKA